MHGASLINLSCPNVKLKINALMEWRIKRRASERVSGKGRWNELSFIFIDVKTWKFPVASVLFRWAGGK